jgi:acyl dehydratase
MDPVRDTDVIEGRAVTARRVVTQADFDRFARLTGDDNPIHVDPLFAAATRWGRTLCHGMLLYSLIGQVIRTRLLPGAIELEQDLVFPGPTYAGDELTIVVEIVRVDRRRGQVEVRARISRPGGGVCCEGRTLVSHV